MEHKPYNGHYNYETWAVKLWLDNDEGTYNMMRDQARATLDNNTDDGTVDDDGFKSELADWLRNYHDEQAEEIMSGTASVFHDLMNAGLSEVNWREIAATYLDEAKEDAAE